MATKQRHLINPDKPSAALCGSSWGKNTEAVFNIIFVDCYWCKMKYQNNKG